ncbi:putative diphthamide synthesis protein-domain-containing protein [Melanogaster broomeanus]|nr:putative diphthamide synthesis protein-domain-containing protein [Melanogaster broomeanus]
MSADQPPSAFSPSGEEAITRSIDVASTPSAQRFGSSDFSEFYEIERTTETIINGNFKRIALQFPDELLHDSVPVYRLLKHRVGDGHDLYVLADTSYGSCCVDEVAAQHVEADLVVHYGHACNSKTSRLPVVYVFGRKPIDVQDCIGELTRLIANIADVTDSSETTKKSFLIRHDVAYTYQAGDIVQRLRDETSAPILFNATPTWVDPAPAQAVLDSKTNNDATQETTASPNSTESPAVDEEHTTIIYIGEESLTLTNLLMTHSSSVNEMLATRVGGTNKLLMRRFAAVQKARDADVFGILVGTLGVASYLPLISHLRKILAKAQKKSYTISVGKLNPAKLGNFMEIECFVLAACPENSVIDAKEFFRPIITPYELEVALQAEGTWSGRYVLDFGRLIAEYASADADRKNDDDRDPDQPTFSLITGKYRHARRFGALDPQPDDSNTSPNAVVLRNQDGTISTLSDSAAAMYLQSRSYQGLDARVGADAPGILEQGRSGIARGYSDDHR